MDDRLFGLGATLEEAFFKKRDAELIEQHRKIEKMKRTRAAMSEMSGISNPLILDKLIALEITPEMLASMAVVPLVEVAWADGRVDEEERVAVLKAAAASGLDKGSVDYALLEAWLKHRPAPKLLDAWTHYIEGLVEVMSVQEINALKDELIGRAQKVAEAAGGILGGVFSVSTKERAVLKKMEDAFVKHSSSGKK